METDSPKAALPGTVDFFRRMVAAVVLLNVALLGLVGYALFRSYQSNLDRADVTTQNLAYSLAQSLASTIDQVDLGLLATKDEVERQYAEGRIDSAALDSFLRRQHRRLPWLIALRVADASGAIRYGIDVPKDAHIDIRDREYFVELQRNRSRGLYINRPVLSKINRVWVVNFSRRLSYPNGDFAGVVYASISLETFNEMFSSLDLGPKGAINLRDAEMGMMVRFPAPHDPGASVGSKDISPEFRAHLDAGHSNGTFYTPTSFDNTARIVSYHQVGHHPLYVTVGLARDDFLDEWQQEVMQMAVMVLLFAAASVAGLILLHRSWVQQVQATRRLVDEEQKFHTVADYTYDWEFWEGEGRQILYMSPSCARLTGYGAEEFLADPDLLLRIVHPDDRSLMEAHRHDVTQQDVTELDYRIIRRDGDVRWISHCCQTVFGRNGEHLGRRVSNRDITERRSNEAANAARAHLVRYSMDHSLDELLEETLNQAEKLTDSQIGFYHFVDEDQNSLWLQNWSTRTKLEFCKAEGKGLHYPVAQAGVWADCLRQRRPVIHNDFASVPNRHGLPEGHAALVRELTVPVFRGDKIVAIIGVGNKSVDYTDKDLEITTLIADLAWDVVERKRNEDELKRYKDHLEEKVQQRTADLVLARNAAETANRAKSVFLASMSHELRTPLNAILGFSNMMRGDEHLPEHLRQYLQIINRSGEHLLSLINDVLEMAKIEAGRVQLENAPFDLGAMVRDVTDMMEFRAREKGLRMLIDQTSEFPRYIVGDEARLRQVLINLVGNAIKFTRQGGVTVRLGTRQNHAAHLMIEVEDSGPGIAPEDQQRIFEPFVQLGEQRDSRGTGLGLTITRQFVHMMGGNITLDSAVGKGSLFRVDLPLAEAHESEIAKTDTEASYGTVIGLVPGQPVFRILVVEDQLENQLLLSKLMESVGFHVKVAENGKEGVDLFQSWHPHLIWMDRKMPVMDGLEATRQIRELPGGTEVKIVAVTASAFQEQRAEMLAAGMDDFVRKPYRFNEIYDCLARQLGVRYLREDEPVLEETVTLTPHMLASLPDDTRRQFTAVLESLESDLIAEKIHEIAQYDKKLAKTLAHLADGFDYPSILSALKQLEQIQGIQNTSQQGTAEAK